MSDTTTTTDGGGPGTNSGAGPTSQPTRPTAPDYVMAKVQLLLNQETPPETNVTFTFDSQSQSRADPTTIKAAINPGAPYQLTWTWENQYAREHQPLAAGDVAKYGYQVDIDSYFKLDNLNDPAHPQWTLQPNPDATSNPLELATGASDAVAYHDFYRLQIAFEDVWAELIDNSIGTIAQQFYAKWDALMNAAVGSNTDGVQLAALYSNLSSAKLDVESVISGTSQHRDPALLQSEYKGGITAYINNALTDVSALWIGASDAFKNAFGLSIQNIQDQLQAALDGTDALLRLIFLRPNIRFGLRSGAGTDRKVGNHACVDMEISHWDLHRREPEGDWRA